VLQNSVGSTLTFVCSKLVAWMKIGSLLRGLIWRRKVGIALYHSVDPEVFEAHLRVLKRNYNLISLGTLVDALGSDDWGQIPSNALVITFDDGMKDVYELRGLLAENHVPAMVYLVSDLVGTHRHFWFNEVDDPQVVERLMREPNSARLAYLSRHVGYTEHREYEERQALSMDEIHDMAASGVQFGGHTASHPILPACEDSAARREIVAAKAELEAKTGLSIEHFCYPNGDYTARDEDLVRHAGYRSARTVERGLNGRGTSPYRLRIVDVLEDRSAADLELIECRLVWYGIKQWFGETCRECLPRKN
jgi:peptidoglycan/xylan/chitin deacetylase (PgdA/CDA1 family)